MRSSLLALFLFLSLSCPPSLNALADTPPPAAEKEWTFLTFINGNNDLDRYGAININQMETVGSTDQINVVVQWASLARGTSQRMLIQKDSDPDRVTSPVLEEISRLDMGDWHNLVDFVRWAHETFPAKHYFLNVWNHGTGWHLTDISYDDVTDHFITTKQLGDALREAAKIIGHKVDLYASDACLMAMIEVANEMADAVEIFAGSEELEPSQGWPYKEILARWTSNPTLPATEVAKLLTEEYIRFYQNYAGSKKDVTFSAFDLTRMNQMNDAIRLLSETLPKLDKAGRSRAESAAQRTLRFTTDDYGDFGLFISALERENIPLLSSGVLERVREEFDAFVILSQATGRYAKTQGLSIWFPPDRIAYQYYAQQYATLRFQAATGWGRALRYLLAF